jgi:hypothetical protein
MDVPLLSVEKRKRRDALASILGLRRTHARFSHHVRRRAELPGPLLALLHGKNDLPTRQLWYGTG